MGGAPRADALPPRMTDDLHPSTDTIVTPRPGSARDSTGVCSGSHTPDTFSIGNLA